MTSLWCGWMKRWSGVSHSTVQRRKTKPDRTVFTAGSHLSLLFVLFFVQCCGRQHRYLRWTQSSVVHVEHIFEDMGPWCTLSRAGVVPPASLFVFPEPLQSAQIQPNKGCYTLGRWVKQPGPDDNPVLFRSSEALHRYHLQPFHLQQ